jgi:MFS family permease
VFVEALRCGLQHTTSYLQLRGVDAVDSARLAAGGCTLAAFSPGYWWFAVALAVIGVAALTFTNATNSMMQLSTKPTMRGRVMAIRVGVALGGTAMGAPIVGWVANHFGPRWSLGIGAVSAFLAALVAALMMAKPVAAPVDT